MKISEKMSHTLKNPLLWGGFLLVVGLTVLLWQLGAFSGLRFRADITEKVAAPASLSAEVDGKNLDGATIDTATPTILFRWPAVNDPTITNYHIVISDPEGKWVDGRVVDGMTTDLKVTTKPLENKTFGYFIQAGTSPTNWGEFIQGGKFTVNTGGTTIPLNPVDTTPPSIPTNFGATINGQDANGQTVTTDQFTMQFNWGESQDAESGVKQYHIRILDADDSGHVVAKWFIPAPANNFLAMVSGLPTGHTYAYFIHAQNNADPTGDNGDLWSDWASGGQFVLNTTPNCILKPNNDISVSGFSVNEGGNTATVTLKNKSPLCTYQVALSSYQATVAWDGTNSPAYLGGQHHFQIRNATLGKQGSGTESITLTVGLPSCQYQVDVLEYHNGVNPILTPPDFGAHLNDFTLFDWKQNTTRPLCTDTPAVCGPAIGTYQVTDTAFRLGFCSAGTIVGPDPVFPGPGGSVQWQCQSPAGNVSCGATRLNSPPNNPLLGFHDNASCAFTEGWACDGDNFAQPLQVEIYDGPRDAGGHLIGTTTANIQREAAVGAVCGGNALHGFHFQIPASLQNSQAHTLYAYGLDLKSNGQPSSRVLLAQSPRSFSCNQPVAPVCTLLASPQTVIPGGKSTLNWTISRDATSASIAPNIGPVPVTPGSGSQEVTVQTATTYVMTVTGPGGSSTCSAPITIGAPLHTTLTLTKTANPIIVKPNDVVTYTLNYSNTGSREATRVAISDDYDETRLTEVTVPAPCTVDATAGLITCPIGTLAAGASGQISYTAKVKPTVLAGEHIDNIATLTSATSDPITATARVVVQGSLVITKIANPTEIRNGQESIYTLTVTNTDQVPHTFTIQDVLTAVDSTHGGSLTLKSNSVSATFTPPNSGTLAGNTPSQLIITNLAAGAVIQIQYVMVGNDSGIRTNDVAQFANTATIIETGANAHALVTVIGPTGGGGGGGGCSGSCCSGNCGGGGGGGGGRIPGEVNLSIKKEVQDLQKIWQDANTFDLAAIIKNSQQQLVSYRITLKNSGAFTGKNITIQDIFSSSNLARMGIRNVKGAIFDDKNNSFKIDQLNSGATTLITYDALLRKAAHSPRVVQGLNTATITAADTPTDIPSTYIVNPTKGIGTKDDAYVKTEDKPGEVTLRKRVDKTVAKVGEEVNYILTVRNQSGEDLKGLVLTDHFPFTQLTFLSSDVRGVQKGDVVEYSKPLLQDGALWIIRVKAQVKSTVTNGETVRNFVTITAKNMDLSKKRDQAEFIVQKITVPNRLFRSGAGMETFFFFIFGGTLAFFGLRKRYRMQ